jgi:ankyrin repeat protein
MYDNKNNNLKMLILKIFDKNNNNNGEIIFIINSNNGKNEATWSEKESNFELVVNNKIIELESILKDNSNKSNNNSKAQINLKNENGLTPLHFSADRGYVELTELLLKNGANVNEVDNEFQTPLMYAVNCENIVSDLFFIF